MVKLRLLHLDLLDVGLAYLKERGLLDKALKMQATKDDATRPEGTQRTPLQRKSSATSSR